MFAFGFVGSIFSLSLSLYVYIYIYLFADEMLLLWPEIDVHVASRAEGLHS